MVFQTRVEMIHNQKNMTNNGATERLLNLFCEIKTFNTIARQKLTCPILSLPANDEYWSEGWQNSVHSYVCSDLYATPSNKNELLVSMPSVSSPVSSNSSSPSPSQSDQSNASSVKMQPYCELDFDYVNEQVYHTSFLEKEHLVFYGQDTNNCSFVLSYKTERKESIDFLKIILRTRESSLYNTLPVSFIEEPILPKKVIHLMCPDMKIKQIYPMTNINGFELIRNFDKHTLNKTFKFGVIYMKKGQVTEEEIFSNQEHSQEFEDFLDLLGTRIKLKDFTGYRGGLDAIHDQTGEYSIYEKYNEKEIMFHISTLLPYNKNDLQQLERKRHIGNDIVSIVFQEDNTTFAPDMIASHFLHSFIVVQHYFDAQCQKIKYRVAVTARKDVPNFGPPISSDCIYDHDKAFKDWLINKLINSETACYKAEKFKKLKERTRLALFDTLYRELYEQNQLILMSLFPNMIFSEDGDFYNHHHHHHQQHAFRGVNHMDGGSMMSMMNASSQNLSSSNASFRMSILNSVKKVFRRDSKDSNTFLEDLNEKPHYSNRTRSSTCESTSPTNSQYSFLAKKISQNELSSSPPSSAQEQSHKEANAPEMSSKSAKVVMRNAAAGHSKVTLKRMDASSRMDSMSNISTIDYSQDKSMCAPGANTSIDDGQDTISQLVKADTSMHLTPELLPSKPSIKKTTKWHSLKHLIDKSLSDDYYTKATHSSGEKKTSKRNESTCN